MRGSRVRARRASAISAGLQWACISIMVIAFFLHGPRGSLTPVAVRCKVSELSLSLRGHCLMLIVDAQIHLWEKGTPSAHHRQEPYSAEQAIAGMDAAGVGRALIHPVMWDPDSNELAVEAVRAYPGRFAIMGWFYLDQPENRALVE